MPRIAVIPGDGIGLEVIREAVRVLEVVEARFAPGCELVHWDLGADRYLRDGITITDEEFASLADEHDAILLGALGDPRVPGNQHARDILLGLRFKLDLYVNYRPAVLFDPELSPLRDPGDIRLDVFRENTEGVYVNLGGTFKAGTRSEIAIQEDLNTWAGVERICRAAFEHAVTRGRSRVTLVDKANAMPAAGKLWRRVFGEVAGEFPSIETDAMYVDAMAMDLVRRPNRYEVIVTGNLFGDILSDLAAELVGGLGTAASANLHPGRHALFEPVHGSAPDIAGQGLANPMGAIASVVLMLEYLGHDDAARAVDDALHAAVDSGVRTADMGGSADTEEVGTWIAARISDASA
ncbi:MAG: 3-isopropylmalate dehydrogenase [Gemmatimonadetes bacterium]|nr:3-isopropylmalate dehydrogenase [Gemmatimonadota bacterium]MBT8403893.1 3-isopropylmalate dehydrogenase [Gemmatimonadota bacterium]NNF38315.1 3-isopropylmalate dehydrogenase [Gemmatimonadota bacterium]NNK61834.1 3-isopropylmalate dehydrogenase [Gemmatimonadota bacterium]